MGGKKSKASDKSFALEDSIQHRGQKQLEIEAKTRAKSVAAPRQHVNPQNINTQNIYQNSNEWNVPQQQQNNRVIQQPIPHQQLVMPPQYGYVNGIQVPVVLTMEQQEQMLIMQSLQQQQQYQYQQQHQQIVQHQNFPQQQQRPLPQQNVQQRPQQVQANQQPQNLKPNPQQQAPQTNQRRPPQQQQPRLSEYGSEVDSQDDGFQDAINEAIIQSIFEQEQSAEEEQMLREVMKISSLEHQKQNGLLSLDHLKKKKTIDEKNMQLQQSKPQVNGGIKVNPNDLPPVEIGGKKSKNLVMGNGNDDVQQIYNNDFSKSIKNDPQNLRDHQKLSTVQHDPKAAELLKAQKQQQEMEEKRLLEILTPSLVGEDTKSNTRSQQNKKSPMKDKKETDEDFFGDSLEISPKKPSPSKNRRQEEDEEFKDHSQINAFDDLVEQSMDGLNFTPQKIDKDKLKEIMKKKNKSNLKDEFDNSDLHKGDPNSIFYENQDTKETSSKVQQQVPQLKVEEESEDEFDKLIGHMEGSRSNQKVVKHQDVEEEDFF